MTIAVIFEIIQTIFNVINSALFFMPWNWLEQWFGLLRTDFGQMYVYKALNGILKARGNLRCAVDEEADRKGVTEPQYQYTSEMEYYLNTMEATQRFYLGAHNSYTTFFGYITVDFVEFIVEMVTLLLATDAVKTIDNGIERVLDDGKT